MARMKDVADRAGVSVATVSNVLTGKRAVTPEVRENVLRAIKELDYHVNMIARGSENAADQYDRRRAA